MTEDIKSYVESSRYREEWVEIGRRRFSAGAILNEFRCLFLVRNFLFATVLREKDTVATIYIGI